MLYKVLFDVEPGFRENLTTVTTISVRSAKKANKDTINIIVKFNFISEPYLKKR